MGTRLRNVKKQNKGLGGTGKLTMKLINDLTICYGLAIRNNCNSKEEMRKAIWATFYHKISTDKEPQHHNCPVGTDSWCSWQKAKGEWDLEELCAQDTYSTKYSKCHQTSIQRSELE